MLSSDENLRIEIRAAVKTCIAWVELARFAAEKMEEAADDPRTEIDFKIIGEVMTKSDEALRTLDGLVEELLKADVPLDGGEAATALAFYSNPANYVSRRGQSTKVTEDGGTIARKALSKLGGSDNTGGEEDK